MRNWDAFTTAGEEMRGMWGRFPEEAERDLMEAHYAAGNALLDRGSIPMPEHSSPMLREASVRIQRTLKKYRGCFPTSLRRALRALQDVLDNPEGLYS